MTEWGKRALLVSASFFLVSGLGEVGLRLLSGIELATPVGEGQGGFMERGAANLYIPQSGTRQQRQDPYGRPFTLRINSTGQRGD